MSVIDPTMPLGALVTAHPVLASTMERLGLDFCCGGNRTLAEACTAAGVDLLSTITVLTAATVSPSSRSSVAWTTMDAPELVDHLVSTHHRYLWEELPHLVTLVDKIVSVHGSNHPELVAIATCIEDIRSDLEPHLLKEERVLFPLIKDLAGLAEPATFRCESIRKPVSVMMREHDEVGELLAKLRALTNGYQVPVDGCASYAMCFRRLEDMEADTHLHIHKENNVLFPLVLAMEEQHAGALR